MKDSTAKKVAQTLLSIQAVKLQPNDPFTWASGIKSPIYCDNRLLLSYPEARSIVRDAFIEHAELYEQIDTIAGVATGGIAHGALVAEKMNKPFIYVRSSAKKHGRENQVEGYYEKGQKVLVIEDLISTGGSSIQAVDALRSAGLDVLAVVSIFSYGFELADKNFKAAECPYASLSDYATLLQVAQNQSVIHEEDVNFLQKWRADPQSWKNRP